MLSTAVPSSIRFVALSPCTHREQLAGRRRIARHRPTSNVRPGIGYEFPYWLKRAFGAMVGPRAAGGAGAPSSRTPPPRGCECTETAPVPIRKSAVELSETGITARSSTHRRATDPLPNGLHVGTRRPGRSASLRDDLRPPLTPATAEQQGWLSGRLLSSGQGTNVGTNAAQNRPANHYHTGWIQA